MEDDLLYTNKFVNTSSLTPQQLNQDANQFIPYRTLKGGQVNNVQSTLERTFRQDNPLTQRQLRAYGWNKGEFGNERPVLSDFARDIGESSYFRYKTSYLNVDSRMRDVSLYPRPNNYEIFLGRKFQNVESIKLVDYFFPEMSYPINYMNHVVMWMTIPFEMIVTTRGGLIDVVPSVTYKTGDLNICSFVTDFRQLANNAPDCETAKNAVSNNIMKNVFTIDIPSGNYTTEELAEQIEYLWNQKLFFDSDTFSAGDYFFIDPNSQTYNFYRKPQNVKVTIDAHTSMVNFLLRYESVKVEKMQSYINKNYFDITLKVPDPLVSSQQYLDLVANEIFPIVLTDFPSLGGFRQENINYKEFLPYKQVELNNDATLPPTDWLYKTYYGKVTDPDTGNPVPNVLRFYMYDAQGHEAIFSSDEIILYDDVCKLLCGAID